MIVINFIDHSSKTNVIQSMPTLHLLQSMPSLHLFLEFPVKDQFPFLSLHGDEGMSIKSTKQTAGEHVNSSYFLL